MTNTWEQRIAAFWETADDARPEDVLSGMRLLVSERADDDPEALFEWASVHDFLGREGDAVPLYRAALSLGLSGERRPQAVIQLASSLRNLGEPEAAAELLADAEADSVVGDAARAFLALCLWDAGRGAEALRVALTALAPTLPMYARAVSAYADALVPGAPEGVRA